MLAGRRSTAHSVPILSTMATAAGKAQTFNDLYELDTSTPEEYKWKQISSTGNAPPPRARHCAVAVSAVIHSDCVQGCCRPPVNIKMQSTHQLLLRCNVDVGLSVQLVNSWCGFCSGIC